MRGALHSQRERVAGELASSCWQKILPLAGAAFYLTPPWPNKSLQGPISLKITFKYLIHCHEPRGGGTLLMEALMSYLGNVPSLFTQHDCGRAPPHSCAFKKGKQIKCQGAQSVRAAGRERGAEFAKKLLNDLFYPECVC